MDIKVFYENGTSKWCIDDYFKSYLENQQDYNLPKLENIGCFIVVSDNDKEHVLIDNKQNVLYAIPYNNDGFEQMKFKINTLKLSKYFN